MYLCPLELDASTQHHNLSKGRTLEPSFHEEFLLISIPFKVCESGHRDNFASEIASMLVPCCSVGYFVLISALAIS